MTFGGLEAAYRAEEFGDDWDWPLAPGPQTAQLLAEWELAAEVYRQAQTEVIDFFRQQGFTPYGREDVRHPLPKPRR